MPAAWCSSAHTHSVAPPSSVHQVYKNYIVAGGTALIVVALIFYCIGQVSSLAQGFIVAVWTQAVPDQHGWYMLAFALNAIIMALIAFIRTFTLVSHSVRASIKLHNRLLNRIMRAPVSFFDTTPVGTGCWCLCLVSSVDFDHAMLCAFFPRSYHFAVLQGP